ITTSSPDFFIFFFSSRRRHTRWPRDWSSDVCSSDLFEQKLWQMADKLRGHMDAAEYKHVVLGLIFLKYVSDAFQERHAALEKERSEERRVGKECRSQEGRDQENDKQKEYDADYSS